MALTIDPANAFAMATFELFLGSIVRRRLPVLRSTTNSFSVWSDFPRNCRPEIGPAIRYTPALFGNEKLDA